ncbi:hypothetical protein ABVV53_11380 [Novosphingobium sp. RD2P27]|uniref:DUF2946 domain-containing protein n=1 Tax=Novosphingobium kalidii TaxID=3230299 RepID=A0ABV2D438_9SPHN
MFRRLLAMLLLLALSAPALAMSGHCAAPPADSAAAYAASHEAAVPKNADHEHTGHSAPVHAEGRDCIGCVLPDLGRLAAPEAELRTILIGAPRPLFALNDSRARPETPPPRA